MYKDKGLIKVYNGFKYKTVSYLKEGETIIFTTSKKSNKYNEFIKDSKLKALIDGGEYEYNITIIEDDNIIDSEFNKLKSTKAIPFFIPRKNKIIVKYEIS